MLRFLEHKSTSNIVGIINALTAISAFILAVYKAKNSTPGAESGATTQWIGFGLYGIIAILIVALLNASYFILFIIRRRKARQREFIGKLSLLQGSNILAPRYVTADEHGKHSKERDLAQEGTANILTNSLNYDMFYADEIARNMISGAQYIYIVPNTNRIFEDLQNFISIVSQKILVELSSQQTLDTRERLTRLLRTENLEFWFFNRESPCLYNFAIFRQTAENGASPYVQYWWYINPSDTEPNSHMLACEIKADGDKGDLDDVIHRIKKGAAKRNGQEVYDNRTNLREWIGEI